jgi:hypothetical protein
MACTFSYLPIPLFPSPSLNQTVTKLFNVGSEIDALNVVRVPEAPMHHGDCHDALTRLVKLRLDLLVGSLLRLKHEHRIYQLKAVLNPVVHLFHKKALLDEQRALVQRPAELRVQVTINWAGNPHKPAEVGADVGTLTPRKSFEIWKETVHDHSEPWSAAEGAYTLDHPSFTERDVQR